MIGKWLASRGVRAEMRIATKTGMFGKGGDLAPQKVAEELGKSLERLQTDYIDLYYAHRDEAVTPQDEVVAGFDALVKQGLVRELGASNFSAERLASAHSVAHSNGMASFTVLQNEYNLVMREEYPPELQALCIEHGMAMLPWFGLAAGFLTGKYRTREDLERHNRGSSIERFFDKGLTVLPVLDAVVAETGASHGAVALAWLLTPAGDRRTDRQRDAARAARHAVRSARSHPHARSGRTADRRGLTVRRRAGPTARRASAAAPPGLPAARRPPADQRAAGRWQARYRS